LAAGLPVPVAVAAASTTPARVLGLADRTGALRPGLAADLVVCGDDFRPRAVMRQGQWLDGPGPLARTRSAAVADRAGERPAGRADLADHGPDARLPGLLVGVDV